MVLCAGLGTRLRPLTERLPKPAVPLCGAPLVAWTLALLRGAGVRRAVVNTHHLPREMAAAAAGAARALGLPERTAKYYWTHARAWLCALAGGRRRRSLERERRSIGVRNRRRHDGERRRQQLRRHRGTGGVGRQ